MADSESRKRVQDSMRELARKGKLEKLAVRDGFENELTGAGTARSKASAGAYSRNALLQPFELETLFQDNDLAYTIVSKPVEDSLRAWCTFERPDSCYTDADEEDACRIQDEMERLNIPKLVSDGAVFGRLLGGAGVIIGARGAGALSAPMDDEKVTKLEGLFPFDRQDLAPLKWYANGEVELYLWTQPVMGEAVSPKEVHSSRVLMFPGATTTTRVRNSNQGWDVSVLQRVYKALSSFDSMFLSCDAMFSDASQAVFKLQGLIQSLAEADGTGANAVATRLAWMDMTRSTDKAIVLDAGDENGEGAETFEVVDRDALGTLAPMLQQYYIRLAAAARMPLTVLLGMSPSGMSATGESDLILYYNTVDIDRRTKLQPRIERLLRLVCRSLGIASPEQWRVCWPELARPTPLDVATGEKMAIESAVALVVNQVLLPEEVAVNLKKIAPSMKLRIDLAPRHKAIKEGLEEIESREMTGANAAEAEEPVGAAPAAKMSKRKTPAKTKGQQ